MKVIEIQGSFGLDSLKVAERPDLSPKPYHVVVQVKAVSLNFRDYLMVKGQYNPKQKLPLVPCSDGVGTVTAVGEGVTRVKVGDRVAGIFSQTWVAGEPNRAKLASTLGGPLDGMLAEQALLHEDGVVHVPAHLSDEEAATLPCAGVTAWSALSQGNVKAGDTLLVEGTGGVSMFALQFGKLLGARVIATSSSDAKLEKARALGASDGINYKTEPQWSKKARELTSGVGVDHVIDVGGAETLDQALRAVRMGGQISVIGQLSGNVAQVNLIPILMQNVRVQGVLVGSRETFESMNKAVSAHKLRPVLDKVFPFTEARAAFEYLASGAHFGKVGIRI
ncbi:MAG TPA: NAD(P)-dependent alcohol dehydrogenase [Myxococcaceae bacterium]|nr:NAD(P)-dependent alcohol dehydrogenase [Myxococcaceae bacterium]